jgi:hypothetical protein
LHFEILALASPTNPKTFGDAGAAAIRVLEQKDACGAVCEPLLNTRGKTVGEARAVWLRLEGEPESQIGVIAHPFGASA